MKVTSQGYSKPRGSVAYSEEAKEDAENDD